ncbi:L,D-transpeptidase family protein [Nonomuraea sp. SYSU D8015]|uniref:L,D-transpeptidase family protein n=1 Tax=Nonomuraea sp. SYSU D8015 TaxID=2593644 RepID=UPI001CB7580B|nr:L,D-transpeptidase family protein [Nonomuraea sp. SYSU D8015]
MGARRLPGMAALLTAGAVALSGCGTQATQRPQASPVITAAVPVATQTAPAGGRSAPAGGRSVPAAETVTAPRKTLKLGAKGEAVTWLQKRLTELGYRPGRADGRYGGTTLAAVWAFQKVNGIRPTSTIAKRTWEALETPKAPKVLVKNGSPTRAEVNLTKQIMVMYIDGQARLITHISSGSGVPYCETTVWQGKEQRFCGSARTPTGNYKTTWRKSGWHKSYLGELYNPIFFNGGIAFHGALSVPLYPASHGCVRMPMNVAEVLPGMLGKGVPVHVRGAFKRP